jgi:hypothetical protein
MLQPNQGFVKPSITYSTALCSCLLLSFLCHGQNNQKAPLFFSSSIINTSENSKPFYPALKRKKYIIRKQQALIDRFRCFGNPGEPSAFSITICADVPDNEHPDKVLLDGKPGHVFLIFSKSTGKDTFNTVFGFYPKHAAFLLCRYIRSEIRDNSYRAYDACLKRSVNANEFTATLNNAVLFAHKRYHLKKYNCYDYALDIFNSLPGEKIDVIHIRFPFLMGKGGTPCSLYSELKKMKTESAAKNFEISFGSFLSPMSYRQNQPMER